MDRKMLSRLALGFLTIAPIALVAQGPARCDSIQYRFVDNGAPTTARRYRNPRTGDSYALRDTIVLDGHGIARIDVLSRRVGTDTMWDVAARLTPAGAAALETATASHIGSMIAVLAGGAGDGIVQTAIIQSPLRTLIPIRTDLSRAAADSIAVQARRVTAAACTDTPR